MAGIGSESESVSGGQPGSAAYNVMKETMKYRKLDAHIHALLGASVTPELLIDFADRLGVEKMMISLPVTKEIATQEDIKAANDKMIKILKQYPNRFRPMFTLNVQYQKESLEEMKRCVDNGLVGLKVYYQVKFNDPLFYPIIEKMIDLKMITLMHSYIGLGRSSYRTKYGNMFPNESTPMDFVDVAKRYPEALLQFAHTGGGGDWEFECKAMADYPNIFVDVSGSNNEENMINYALKYLGEDRLFFVKNTVQITDNGNIHPKLIHPVQQGRTGIVFKSFKWPVAYVCINIKQHDIPPSLRHYYSYQKIFFFSAFPSNLLTGFY
jgi:predicted TIM-barrel fold metal-dependent hydrolase